MCKEIVRHIGVTISLVLFALFVTNLVYRNDKRLSHAIVKDAAPVMYFVMTILTEVHSNRIR